MVIFSGATDSDIEKAKLKFVLVRQHRVHNLINHLIDHCKAYEMLSKNEKLSKNVVKES